MSAQEAFRGDFSYPLVLNGLFQPVAGTSTFGWYGTLNQGIPRLEGPDLSTGRMHLPNDYGMQTAVPESTHRGRTHSWNVAVERRMPLNVSVDVAYVGNKLVGGLPPGETQTININNVQHIGGGDTDRPYFPIVRTSGRHRDLLAMAQDELSRAADRRDAAVHAGVDAEGPLHVEPVEGAASRLRGAGSRQSQDRNWALANGDRPHVLQMAFIYQLPWRSETGGGGIARTLINDWQINGIFGAFSGSPFTVTADGTELNTPGNLQTADLGRAGECDRRHRRRRLLLWTRPRGRSPLGVRFGNTAAEPVPRPGRLEPRPVGVPLVPSDRKPPHRGARRSVQRHQHAEFRQSDEQHHQRRFHAHPHPVRLVCGTAGEAGGALQLLTGRDVPGAHPGTSDPSEAMHDGGGSTRARALRHATVTAAPEALAPAPPSAAGIKTRILSIDAFRGFVMFLMLAEAMHLMNVRRAYPGSRFWAFVAFNTTHVPWQGCSLHDLIQPAFSFLAGAALPFSIASRTSRGESWNRMLLHADLAQRRADLPRDLPALAQQSARPYWTFEDTLTQIGLGYTFLFLLAFTSLRVQIAAFVAILVGFWAGVRAVSPAAGRLRLHPGRRVRPDWPHLYSGFLAHFNKNSNLSWAFDVWFLNLFPRAKPFLYNGGGWSTLSFIPTLATMMLGLWAGRWLMTSRSTTRS